MALEPRIMYDAAAVATVGSAAQTHSDGAPDHAAVSAAEQHAPPVTPSNTGAPDTHASPTQQQSLTQAPNVQTPAPAAPEPAKTTSALDASAIPTVAGGGLHEIVFIDSRTPDYQLLANGVKAGVTAVILDPDKDGLQQIADYLSAHPDPNLATIDIVGHGENGMMFLGSTVLSGDTVGSHATQLAAIGKALQPGGDLMLYGCDVAESAAGQVLLGQIAEATCVDVAASTGLVGNAARGGSWALDATDGDITSNAPFTAETLALYPDLLASPNADAQVDSAADTAGTDAGTDKASGGAGALLTGDVDPDGDTLTVSTVQGALDGAAAAVTPAGVVAHGTYGDLTIKSDGSYSYKATAAFDAIPFGTNPTDQFSFTVTDGNSGDVPTTLTINITGANDAPVITTSSTPSVAENTTVVTALTSTDADTGSVAATFTITGGTDQALFSIVGNNLVFNAGRDYETDAHSYQVEVSATDGTETTAKTLTVSLTDVNDNAPVFTSGTTASTAENTATTTAVYTAAATDADGTVANITVAYSLDGTDAALFNIDATSGAVTFKASPNYEAPADADGNNQYLITVHANDGVHDVTQAVAISVTDLNDNAPVFTSGTTASTAENAATTTAVYTAAATDSDGTVANNTVAYSLDGTDAALFNINATSGAVTFKASPNYEAPADADGNNQYLITVHANDGVHDVTQAVAISVTDLNDNAPVFTSGTTATTAENVTTTTAVYTAAATDADGTVANNTVTYSLDGTDAALFNINATSGAVTFKASPNYEAPADADGNNQYLITVHANDGVHDVTQNVTIAVTDINDTAPVITTSATQSVAENSTLVAALTSTDADTTGTNPATFSISGGADAAKFTISGGNLVFQSAPDFEHPGSSASSNTYVVQVSAFDGVNTTLKTINVSVTDVNEAPTAVADSGTAGENETKSFDVLANDSDPDAGDSKSLSSISVGTVASGNSSINGIDASAAFAIVAGQIRFTPGAQFDALQNGETATVVVTYTMKDSGNLTSSSTFTLTVNGTNDAPVATITPTTFAATEQTALNLKTTGLSVSDVDGGNSVETVTLSVTEGTLTVSAGTSGAGVANSGTGSVTITGTLAQINALLNSDNTSVVSYTDGSDAPAATATLTLAVSDGSASASDTAVISIAAVNDAPVATITPAGYSATEGSSLNLKSAGMSVSDVDGGAGIETVTLSVGEGVLTGTASGAGETVSGSGTSTLTIAGTIAQINNFLGGSGGTFAYVDNNDRPSASTTLTLSINDGGNSGSGGALTGSASRTITITAVGDAPVAANDAYSTTAGSALMATAAAGVLSNDVDPDGDAFTAALVSGPAHGSVTLNADGSFTYTPTAGYSGTDTFTYKAVQGGQQSAVATVTMNVIASTSGTPAPDQYWITTEANISSNDPQIIGATRVMVTNADGSNQMIWFQDTSTSNSYSTPIQDPRHLVIDYVSGLYYITALQLQNGNTLSDTVYVGHIYSSAAPVAVYSNPDSDRANGAAIIDLAIDPTSHTLFVSENTSYDNGTTADNGIFSFSYNVGTGVLGARHALVTYDPTYSDTKLGIQTNYMSAQPVNGILYYETVNYHTWDGTFQIYALNVTTGVSTALMPAGQFPVNYHDNSGQFPGDLTLNTANNELYFTTFNNTAHSGFVYDVSITGAAGTNIPQQVTLFGATGLVLHDVTYNTSNGQLAFVDSDNQQIDLFNVSIGSNSLTLAASFKLGLPVNSSIYPQSIFFTPADLAPVAAITQSTYNAIEQTALVLKGNGLSVSDPDGGTSIETVTLSVGEGVLTVTAGGSGATVSGSGSGTVTITGTLTQINALLASDASSTVNYTDNTDTPSSHTALTLSVNDGRGLTATKVAMIAITAVNDAPAAAITPPSAATYAATEQVALDLKSAAAGKGLSVSDVDGGNGIESVTLSVGQGILNVTAGSSGASVSGSGTGSVTITGTTAQINALLRTDASSTVSYVNTSDTPAASTVLTLLVNDNGNTGTGGAKTASATATITITAVNDAPVAVDDVYSWKSTDGIEASVLANDSDADTSHVLLTAAKVSGPSHGTVTFNSDGTFIYTPNAGFSGADYFTYRTSDGSATSNLATVTINVSGSPITPGSDAYNIAEDGTLTVDASTGVLHNDTDSDPSAVTIVATIATNPAHGTVVLSPDGSFVYTPAANFYGTDTFTYQASDGIPGNAVAFGTVTITVAAVNDAPVLSPLAPTDVGYVENAAATALFASEAITDADNPASFNGGTLSVAITANSSAGDQIVLLSGSGFAVSGGSLIDTLNGNAVIGAVTASSDSFSVLLSTQATPTVVDRLATAFGYQNSTDSPGAADRTVTLTFNDGGNVGSGPAVNVSVHQTVHVTPVNDAPVVTAGNTVGYTEQAAPLVIDGGLTVTDADSTTLSGATVTISNFVAGDTLGVVTIGNITVTSNDNGVLVLSGSDTLANYQAVLRQVTFANSSNDDPTVGGTQTSRTISWSVTDDTGTDNTAATTTVAVTAVNDAPTEVVPSGIRGLPNTAVTITGVSFSDVDSGGGAEQATFSAGSGTFAATTGSGVTVDLSTAHVVRLTGSVANLNAFIAGGGLAFTPDAAASSTDISVVINDQGHTGPAAQSSATAHLIITGNTPPNAPTDSDGSDNTVQEGAAAGTLVGLTAHAVDPDGDSLTYSLVGRGGSAFQIDAVTGVVSVKDGSLIDYESNPSHTTIITVQADDGHGGVISTDFTIAVTDQPPSAPVDTNGATGGTISEGAVNGATVGITASATDVNGGTVTYSLSNNASGRFTINSTTGVVSVLDASLLDYESATSHTITVRASDPSGLYTDQTFTIAVTDVAPTTPSDSNGITGGTISEGAVNGATVGITASATDVHGGTVTYTLTNDAGGRFTIDASTGVVTVLDASLLNFETSTSHSITVRASDPSGLFSDQTFTIAVTDVAPTAPTDGDAAGDAGPANGTVSEGAVNGALVGITATSTDVHGGQVIYSLTDNASGRFAIDSSTGVISVANASLLDYETNTSHSIVVRAADPHGLYTETTFTITVTDVPPTQPVDGDATANTVVEGAANATVVGITGLSTDIHGGTVTYALSADSSHGGFAIDAATGIVTVADSAKVDFESSHGSYNITIKASDPSGSFTEQSFTIAVTDVAPVATGEAITTDEDTAIEKPAAQGLLVNDTDVNNAPLTVLTAVLDAGPAHGTLTLNADGSFKYLSFQDYNGTDSFTYHVSDGTLSSATVTVSLTINPVNDAPVLHGGDGTVSFDANKATPLPVGSDIHVTDVDSPTLAGVTVKIVGGLEPGDDRLAANALGGIVVNYDPATGTLTMTGPASIDDYQKAIASVTFSSTTQRDGSRTLQWSADDGSALFSQSLPVQTALDVSGIITPPHVFADNRPPPVSQTPTPTGLTFDTSPSELLVPSAGDRTTIGGAGYGYYPVHTDAVLSTASDYNVQIKLALASLEAPLGGDVVYVIARQTNGDPLPDWLKFDPGTGTFAGLPPDGMVASIEGSQAGENDVATGALPPDPNAGIGPAPAPLAGKTITVEVLARDSRGNVAVTSFTIELRPRTGKQGWEMDWNVIPDNARHVGLAVSPELAAIEAAVRDATGIVEPFAIRGLPLRHGDPIIVGTREAPAGRAGLSEQMAGIGWRAMNAQTSALLASLQQGR